MIIILIIFSSGLIFLLLGSVNLKYNERFKKSNSIIYANSENRETCWTSFDKKTDEWTETFLTDKPDTGKMGDLFPFDNRNYLKKTIKTIPLPLPDITVISDSIENEERSLKLHLKSGRNTTYLDIIIKTDSEGVMAGINGSGMAYLNKVNGTDWQYIRYYALPPGGIDMKLQLERGKKVEIRLIDVVIGLPDFLPETIKQRPDYMMSRGDRTMVAKSFFY